MKVKGKAKQLFCMVCAFVASFVLTVTAFAEIDIDYTIYGGKYKSNDSSKAGYISISETRIGLVVFWDDNEEDGCFLSGSTTDGYILFPSSCPFYALYDTVTVVGATGVPIDTNPYLSGIQMKVIPDYEVKGGIFGSGKHTISPRQSTVKYIQE